MNTRFLWVDQNEVGVEKYTPFKKRVYSRNKISQQSVHRCFGLMAKHKPDILSDWTIICNIPRGDDDNA